MFAIAASRFPWIVLAAWVIGAVLLVAGAQFEKDLFGRDLIVAGVALATVAKKEEKETP